MLRLLLALSLVALYLDTPLPFEDIIAQLGHYKDHAFSVMIALLLAPSITPWFE